ncbi:MerR family transcriptional regulator [candidate division TA06 bacterium]|nr:MerR family transcriptional regulator [candidate division TA06 bacterium]
MEKIQKFFRIGEVMENSHLSRQVIHHYTQLDLIRETKRTAAGHRLYDEAVFARLERIKMLKAEGKTLLEIRKILNGATLHV